MPNYRTHRGLVGGLLIVAIGVILLLDQQGIVSAGHVFAVFWPAFFMLLGLEDLIAGYSPKKQAWGGLLFVGGSLFLLRNLGYLHIRFALLGPIILIAVGLWMLIWSNAGPWHDNVFGHRGPFGPHGPFGPNGPFGPRGPFGPHGPVGKVFGSQCPGPTAQVPPPAGQAPSGAPGPATAPPVPPNPNPASAGFAGTGSDYEPRDWHEWRQQQKWEQRRQKLEQRRQRHAWKQQWTGQYWDSQARASSAAYDSNDSQFSYSAVLSHVERNITAKNFKSGTVSAFFGGFDIDLSRADIEGDEAVILADAFFGGGEIRIPETWHVVIEGSALFGAFMDETRQRPPEGSASAKRLIIRGTALFGGITIQN
jgi:hypothetical protein